MATSILAGLLLTLPAAAQASELAGQTIAVSVWNAGGVGGSLDASGFPTSDPGAEDSFLFDGAWHPVVGTSLEVKGESFGDVITAGGAECPNGSLSDLGNIGDCEYVELSGRDTSILGFENVPAPTEQSTARFSGIGSPGRIRNADAGAGASNCYNDFSEDGVPVSAPGLAGLETPDLLARPSVAAVIRTTGVSQTSPFIVELSTANLGGVPLTSFSAAFGLPPGWDGVTVGVVVERLVVPAVPAFGLPGLGLLAVATTALGAAASRRRSQPASKTS